MKSSSLEEYKKIDIMNRLKTREGFTGRVAKTGELLAVGDITKESRLSRMIVKKEPFQSIPKQVLRELKFHLIADMSSKSKSREAGEMTLLDHQVRGFTPQELQLLTGIGNPIGIAIEGAQLYEKTKEYTAQLERSNQLKDLFTDIICHDLLNPVGVIKNMSEIMADNESPKGMQQELRIIKSSAEKLEEIIKNVSKFAKLKSVEALDFGVRDLAPIIKEAIESLQNLASEKNMKIVCNLKGEYLAYVNPFIEDVFANLFSNAIKYSPENTKIVVDIKDAGEKWNIMVEDQGEGVPDEDKEKIFERFRRKEKASVKGNGLGLAIVKRVVELHKGNVWVEDRVRGDHTQGSIFHVTLPKG